MKINQIRLQNFLSHRDTIFDISSINPVVIVGKNGAGKSSLVKDSVTWALFGRARGNGDELITEGESIAIVRVDFVLENELYRVERVRDRGKKSVLNLTRIGRNRQSCQLNGATIAETQKKIEN